jgi:hypothetical protein
MLQVRHWRPGRAGRHAGDVRHAAESGSKFRTLAAAPLRLRLDAVAIAR